MENAILYWRYVHVLPSMYTYVHDNVQEFGVFSLNVLVFVYVFTCIPLRIHVCTVFVYGWKLHANACYKKMKITALRRLEPFLRVVSNTLKDS